MQATIPSRRDFCNSACLAAFLPQAVGVTSEAPSSCIHMIGYNHPLGDGRITHREIVPLLERGHSVCFWGRRKQGSELPVHPKLTIRELTPLPRSLFVQMLLTPFLWCQLLILLLGRSRTGDVFVAHEHQSASLAWLASRVRKGHFVYDIHEFWPENFAYSVSLMGIKGLSGLVEAWMHRHERFFGKRADACVLAQPDLLETGNFPVDRCIVLPNYPGANEIPCPLPQPNLPELEAKIAGRPVLLFVGYVTPRAGITQMLGMMETLAKSNSHPVLLLVGQTRNLPPTRLPDEIRKRHLDDCVIHTGWFDHQQLPNYLGLASIGINLLQADPAFYQHNEVTKHFQMAAAGLPIVATDLPVHRRLTALAHNACLVACDDGTEAAEAVVDLLNNLENRDRLAAASRSASRMYWNMEAVSAPWLALYDRLCR